MNKTIIKTNSTIELCKEFVDNGFDVDKWECSHCESKENCPIFKGKKKS